MNAFNQFIIVIIQGNSSKRRQSDPFVGFFSTCYMKKKIKNNKIGVQLVTRALLVYDKSKNSQWIILRRWLNGSQNKKNERAHLRERSNKNKSILQCCWHQDTECHYYYCNDLHSTV